MKNILIINTTGFGVGGITTHIFNYVSELKRRRACDVNITLISTIITDKFYEKKFKELGCTFITLNNRKKNILDYLSQLNKIIRNGHFDIVHVHGNSQTMFLELLIAKKYNVPIRIAHCHNSIDNHPIINKILNPLFRSTYTTALAASQKAGNWIFGLGNFQVLTNAIPIQNYKFSSFIRNKYRKEFHLKDTDVAIAMIGNINKQKNPGFFVKTIKHLKDLQNKYIFIIGDGPLKQRLKNAMHTLGGHVIFTTFRNDIPELLQAFDILVMPSLWEGLPLILVEAQTTGLECFISDKISSEAIINRKLVKRMPLDQKLWIGAIDSYSNSSSLTGRKKAYKIIENSSYNIYNATNNLWTIYNSNTKEK